MTTSPRTHLDNAAADKNAPPIVADNRMVRSISLDLISEPSFIVDQNRVITWTNAQFLRAYHLSEAAVKARMTCEEACGTHLCGTKNCPVSKSQRIGKAVDAEIIRSNGNGQADYFRSRAVPMPGENEMTLVTLSDITETKQLEARLHQLETDLNVIPTPIMEIDTTFAVTYMNPAGAAIAGLTPAEAVGRKCYDLFKTPHCKTEKCACARAMKIDGVVSEHTIARPAEGVIIPIKYTGAPIKDAKGNIKGGLEYMVDITSEAKVAHLINSASEEVSALVLDTGAKMDQGASALDEMIQSLENEVSLLETSATTVHTMLASAEEMLKMVQNASEVTSQVAKDAENGKKAGTEAGRKQFQIGGGHLQYRETGGKRIPGDHHGHERGHEDAQGGRRRHQYRTGGHGPDLQ